MRFLAWIRLVWLWIGGAHLLMTENEALHREVIRLDQQARYARKERDEWQRRYFDLAGRG